MVVDSPAFDGSSNGNSGTDGGESPSLVLVINDTKLLMLLYQVE
jgi:hypothetical protein